MENAEQNLFCRTIGDLNMIDFEMAEDTLEELQKKLEDYKSRYDPRGYGTTIWQPQQHGEKWVARIVRSESCD